jgi:predicted aldo/keto reductase-like oxidoreductase
MQYRSLGRKSPLQVSALCLGTMMFADQTALAEAKSIVDHAAEHGVNFIDTADVYSLGGSERMVGELLRGRTWYTKCSKLPSFTKSMSSSSLVLSLCLIFSISFLFGVLVPSALPVVMPVVAPSMSS